MRTIRLTDESTREQGLRIITLNGPVEFTGRKGEYRVPNIVIELLHEQHIPYEDVNPVPGRR